MSALGQKQTCAVQKRMSALPPKADMCGATSGCPLSAKSGHRYQPYSIISSARSGESWGTVEAERLGGLEIDDKLEFGRLRNW